MPGNRNTKDQNHFWTTALLKLCCRYHFQQDNTTIFFLSITFFIADTQNEIGILSVSQKNLNSERNFFFWLQNTPKSSLQSQNFGFNF